MSIKCQVKQKLFRGGAVLLYFSVRGRAAEQGTVFRIPTPGQGITFVKIGSMTGSIRVFVILTPKGRFRPFALCKCDSNRLDGNISTFSIDFVQISLQSTTLSKETKGQGIV